jgi:hypothetical protein
MKFISPDDLQQAACDQMLSSNQPVTDSDWMLCVNFWAANIEAKAAKSVCNLMAMLYGCPLDSSTIAQIADFQISERVAK